MERYDSDAPRPRTRGGWDGVIVSYSEGCDDDTVEATIGHYLAFVCRITFRDGSEFDTQGGGIRRNDAGELELYFHRYRDVGDYDPTEETVPFADVMEVHIY